jgi:SAM-dependent methyltransferase
MRLMRRLRAVGRRVLDLSDKLFFPEAGSARDQWQRVVMNRVVDRHLSSLGPASLSAAEISGNARSQLGWKSFRSLNYPDFDLCAPVPAGLCFDVVICEQVLEHVVDPWQAAANLRALCAPGGHVVVTSPFLIKVHEIEMFGLRDYWRFTPRGLHALLEGVGLQVETIDGWGNRMCVLGNLSRWAAYRRWLPLRNEPDIPLQLWAFAKNPT